MDERLKRGRNSRVGDWMELFRAAAGLPEFRVPAESPRSFDFDFKAPSETEANALASWLREHTAYSVEVEHREPLLEGPSLLGWRVGGTTPPLDPSPRIFEQWLAFIVDAGLALGCELEACGGIDLAMEMPGSVLDPVV